MTRRPYEPPAMHSLSPALVVGIFTTAKTQPGLSVEGHLWLAVGTCRGCRRTVQPGATLRVHEGVAYHPACAPVLVLAT